MQAVVYRSAVSLFSILCYGVFLLVFMYLLAFLGNVQVAPLVSKSIDLGRDMGSPATAVLIDVGLILLFGLQHSAMARPGFKRLLTRVVPTELERGAQVLISSAVLALLMWQWRPIPTPVLWHADAGWSTALGWSVMIVGGLVLLSTFLTPYLNKVVRHPIYLGWLLILWGTPTMTAGHLLLATGLSGYLVIATCFFSG